MPQTHRPPVIPFRKRKPPNWRLFDFPERQQKLIQHQWGQHYQRFGRDEPAIVNFKNSIAIPVIILIINYENCDFLH